MVSATGFYILAKIKKSNEAIVESVYLSIIFLYYDNVQLWKLATEAVFTGNPLNPVSRI